jgi:hypothetical protein
MPNARSVRCSSWRWTLLPSQKRKVTLESAKGVSHSHLLVTWSWWTSRSPCTRVVVLLLELLLVVVGLMEEMVERVLSTLIVLRRMIGALYLVAPVSCSYITRKRTGRPAH